MCLQSENETCSPKYLCFNCNNYLHFWSQVLFQYWCVRPPSPPDLLLPFPRGVSCGLYATNSAEVCQYIASDCKANIAVVEDQKQLDKFLKVSQLCDSMHTHCESGHGWKKVVLVFPAGFHGNMECLSVNTKPIPLLLICYRTDEYDTPDKIIFIILMRYYIIIIFLTPTTTLSWKRRLFFFLMEVLWFEPIMCDM